MIQDRTELEMGIERYTTQERMRIITSHDISISVKVTKIMDEAGLNKDFLPFVRRLARGDQMLVPVIIRKICTSIETSLTEISDYMAGPNIDYARATACANGLQRTFRRCSIGAESMQRACSRFVLAAAAENEKLSRSSLHSLCDEYCRLRPKLLEILQKQVELNSPLEPIVLNIGSRLLISLIEPRVMNIRSRSLNSLLEPRDLNIQSRLLYARLEPRVFNIRSRF